MNNFKSRNEFQPFEAKDVEKIFNVLASNFSENQNIRIESENVLRKAELCTGYLSCLYVSYKNKIKKKKGNYYDK